MDLDWLKIFLNHYFNIGVDFIVLYTVLEHDAVRPSYSKALDELLTTNPTLKSRVTRYDWSALAALPVWAHGQAAMINHGNNIFR